MYIQNNPQGKLPFSLPKGYSGSAFEPPRSEPIEPLPPNEPQEIPGPPAPTPPPEPQKGELEDNATVDGSESDTASESAADAAPAFSQKRDRRDQGIFSRVPFLSSLLPPPRRGRGEKGALPEWAILGIVLLLLLDTPDNDLLPFLLILLLWD